MNPDRSPSRRTVLKTGLAVAGAASLPGNAGARIRKRPLGLQLYTLMALLDADMDGTLAKVAALGSREVETLGSFGRDPRTVKAMLDRHGLRSPSQHIMPPALYPIFAAGSRGEIDRPALERAFIDAFAFHRIEVLLEACVRQAQVLGQTYIVWQISWPSQLGSIPDIDRLIKAVNRAADICHAHGMRLGYHNHAHELAAVGTDIPYDLIIQGTDPDRVKLEMDLAWTIKAGADPLTYFRRYPGRFRMLHMKDVARDGSVCDPGTGIVPFHRIIPAAERAGVEHFYVEYDVPDDPLGVAAAARRYLQPLM